VPIPGERLYLMRICARITARSAALATAVLVLAFAGVAGCGSQKPAQSAQQQDQGAKRYPLAGRVVSVNPGSQQVVVQHGDIPGFMDAMTMPYSVKDSKQLSSLAPNDEITADVVVNGDDIHLDNIKVTKKADQASSSSSEGSGQAAPSK
jgi:Cu/Ag efflux protein CusF